MAYKYDVNVCQVMSAEMDRRVQGGIPLTIDGIDYIIDADFQHPGGNEVR